MSVLSGEYHPGSKTPERRIGLRFFEAGLDWEVSSPTLFPVFSRGSKKSLHHHSPSSEYALSQRGEAPFSPSRLTALDAAVLADSGVSALSTLEGLVLPFSTFSIEQVRI